MKRRPPRRLPGRVCSWSFVCVVSVLVWSGWAQEVSAAEPAGDLVVFHAGSLAAPFRQIADAFMREYAAVRVLCEAAGSVHSARKITDLGRRCDVFASSDYAVIEELLIPEHADWAIAFATNEMVIAYTERSRRCSEITAANWPHVLRAKDVVYGRSDPNADPCGYRTVFVLKLAETHYGLPGLAEALLQKDARHIRPKETELLALLEAGAIDYVFIYRSVAMQHGLKCLTLPVEINLSDPKLAKHYRTASVALLGSALGSTITRRGEPIWYGVTIPRNSPNPVAAERFVAFLLDKNRGMDIMDKSGQACIGPSSSRRGAIPASLRRFVADAGTTP